MPVIKKKSFQIRGFVTLTMAVAGLGLPVTGLANHLLQMEPMTLPRHAWMTAHNTLAIFFVVFAVWHAILNRRPLYNHIRSRFTHRPGIAREAACAVALVAVILLLFVGHAFHVS